MHMSIFDHLPVSDIERLLRSVGPTDDDDYVQSALLRLVEGETRGGGYRPGRGRKPSSYVGLVGRSVARDLRRKRHNWDRTHPVRLEWEAEGGRHELTEGAVDRLCRMLDTEEEIEAAKLMMMGANLREMREELGCSERRVAELKIVVRSLMLQAAEEIGAGPYGGG